MSVEIDSPQLPLPKKHGKHNEREVERIEKKRKRTTIDNLQPTSPTKKHRSKPAVIPTSSQSAQTVPLRSTEKSPFHNLISSLYLPIPPISQLYPLQGLLAEHISPLILMYYPPFHGVIISYANPSLSTSPHLPLKNQTDGRPKAYARSIDEYAAPHIWLTAEFLIFRPQVGDVIEGWVNLMNEGNVGVVCWNFFNASVGRERLPSHWTWVPGGGRGAREKMKLKKAATRPDYEDEEGTEEEEQEEEEKRVHREDEVEDTEGYFQDGDGKRIGGLLRFTVRSVETSRNMDRESGFLSIEGTMLGDEEERELQGQKVVRMPGKGLRRREDSGESENYMTGTLMNGDHGNRKVHGAESSRHRV